MNLRPNLNLPLNLNLIYILLQIVTLGVCRGLLRGGERAELRVEKQPMYHRGRGIKIRKSTLKGSAADVRARS